MDTRAVMEARRKATRKGNKHWRRGENPRSKDASDNIHPNEWRNAMDTQGPDFAALIPVDPGEHFPVDGRKLHGALGVGRDFTTWMRGRIGDCGFRPGDDYATNETVLTETGEPASRGFNTRIDYMLTVDMAKHLAMLERNPMGRKVRAYFIECEKRLTTQPRAEEQAAEIAAMPKSAILMLAAQQAEEIERLETRNAVLEPKADALDVLSAGANSVTLQKAGNQLGVGRKTLIRTLKECAIFQPNGQPYRRFLDAGYFEVKPTKIWKGDRSENYPQVFVTQRGLTWLASKMRRWGFAVAEKPSDAPAQQNLLN